MHVVVIGGGLGGICSAYNLRRQDSNIQITLIEPKGYIEVPWASIRALFDESIATGCTFSISAWAEKHNVVHRQSKATSLTNRQVTLDNGEQVSFDKCIIATGSSSPEMSLARPAQGLTLEERRREMASYGRKFLSAKHVLVIGGGAVGTEFATDIMDFARKEGKKVKVTLVHSGDHLIPEFNEKAARRYQDMVEELGVKVILKQRAVRDGNAFKLGNGKRINADLVVNCVGIRPQNEFVNIEGAVNEKGWLIVDRFWKVEGGEGKVFAFGDCCDAGMVKSGANVLGNAAIVARNVAGSKMMERTAGPAVILVTAGTSGGVAMTPLGPVTWGLPWLKNRTMFLFKARAQLGV